ncbi:MAG: hypothetical protein HKP58_16110 [Desulfatitalea sp.]|nr:BMA_0021/BMA_0022 family TOMM bacteriocin [Desulfatitalea sp.]NNK01937.1 hypothetical protein [Desulfatitalea sp.]
MGYDNRLPDYESFLEFEEVYLRAVALAWTDEDFKEKLLSDAESAIEQYFNYRCPWSLDIQVREVNEKEIELGAGWHPPAEGRQGFWKLPKDTFYYRLPPKPDTIDPEEEPIALAAYNDSGPTYLFTCC